MTEPAAPLILVVDDEVLFAEMLRDILEENGYRVVLEHDSRKVAALMRTIEPALVLLDIDMPHLSGLQVCAGLRADPRNQEIPIIMVTAHSETSSVVDGLAQGADDYLPKPVRMRELLARIQTQLRIRSYQRELAASNAELTRINAHLDALVSEKVGELDRANRLRRFFSPSVCERLLSADPDAMLKAHRREITVCFLDLRGFTSFAEKADPPEVMNIIREYHATIGPVIFEYQGTLERFMGDGIMVFIGDPEPRIDHARQAALMALQIRERFLPLTNAWRKRGYPLGMGLGMATGDAWIGRIGFEGRLDYAALGTVTNRAARLCELARDGQILISQETREQIGDDIPSAFLGPTALKGFSQPHPVHAI